MFRLTLSVLCVLVVLPVSAGQYNAVLDIGDAMPTFSNLPSVSGETLSSAEIEEATVVLVSLANHCPWVRGTDADLVKLVKSFADDDVRVVGFSVNHREDDRLPAMKKHAAKVGYNFTYVFDESQALGRQLGATRTPEFFVFNKQRKLVYMGLLHNSPGKMGSGGKVRYIDGEPSEFYVEQAIRASLQNKTVATPETRAHGCSVKYKS